MLHQAMHLQSSVGNVYNGERLSTALSLLSSQLTTFLCIRSTACSIAVFIAIILDQSIISVNRLHLDHSKLCRRYMECLGHYSKGPCQRTQQVETLLRVVGQQCCVRLCGPKSLSGFKQYAANAIKCHHCCGSMQTGATHVVPNNVACCWPTMLRPFVFKRGLTKAKF